MRPSCTIRYADRSRPAGRGDGSPSTLEVDHHPGRADVVESRSRSASPGCGVSSAASPSLAHGVEQAPHLRERGTAGLLDVAQGLAVLAADASGNRCRTAPTCSTITLTACATTSCSSRAIRPRSSATATRAAASRSRSARRARSSAASVRSVRSRSAHPTSQPIANIAGTETRSSGSEPARCSTTTRDAATTITSPARASRVALRAQQHGRTHPGDQDAGPVDDQLRVQEGEPAHTSHVVAGAAKGNRRRSRRTSTAEVMPTRPSTNRGPPGAPGRRARRSHRGDDRGDDDQEVETMPGEEQPRPAHLATVRRPRRRRVHQKEDNASSSGTPRDAAFRRRARTGAPSVEDIFHRPSGPHPEELVMDTEYEQGTYVRRPAPQRLLRR